MEKQELKTGDYIPTEWLCEECTGEGWMSACMPCKVCNGKGYKIPVESEIDELTNQENIL
jgi:DnaJ-class molecular chaperone